MEKIDDPEERSKFLYNQLKGKSDKWRDKQNISGPFENGVNLFGHSKMFEYLSRPGLSRHDGLHNFNKIAEVFKLSGLKPNEFFNNILSQVQKDDSEYDELGSAHHKLNSLADNINADFKGTVESAKKYGNITKLRELLEELAEPEKIFSSWKNLKKYEEVCQLLKKTEILDQLQSLKKAGKEELYKYIETLAFHPNISMQKVFQFWNDPEGFLEIMDSHTPDEVQDRKKPSNYVEFPNLDLTAEELRDALVEGDYDKLQSFKPLEITYKISRQESKYEGKPVHELIVLALGKRKEGVKGLAQNSPKMFSELTNLFKQNRLQLLDYLKSDKPDQYLSGHLGPEETEELKQKMADSLFDKSFGLAEGRGTEEYRAKINQKSDPDGVVAGNDTACCMPFGSGKNNVYTFNPICSLFTIQRKTAENVWRTVAQSVMTKDKEIKENIADLVEKLQGEGVKMHEVVDEEVLRDKPSVITADNIEVAQNFKDNARKDEIIKAIYLNFFKEYVKRFGGEEKLDNSQLIIGQGFTDALNNLRQVDNTFVPEAPVGYSDNLHRQAYKLDLTEAEDSRMVLNRKVNAKNIRPAENQREASLPRGVSQLTFHDSLPVAYIEGKAYHENESLMEYLHNMENALIAKDVNNTAKGRPNMSIKYQDSQGKVRGYLLAYEGRASGKEGENVVYVSDLASDGTARAGGSLILGFTQLYKENYLDKNRPVPILAQLREKTSYQIITKQLDKLSQGTGVKFVMEEIGSEEVGGDTMHVVMIRPEKE